MKCIPATACCIVFLAMALGGQPDPAALIPLYRQALAEREKQYGPEHPKVARSSSNLGLVLRNLSDRATAEPFLRLALEIDIKALGPRDRLVGEDLENLASVLPEEQALRLYRRAAEHPDAVIAARNLARLASFEEKREDRAAALDLYRRALAKEEAAGARHPRVAVRLNDVAWLVDPKEAEPLLRRALEIQEETLGGRHPETATTLNNLAKVLLATGQAARAEPLAERALRILESCLGPNHPRTATGASNLADVLRMKKDYAGARRLYERALAIREKAHGPEHPEVAVELRKLAALLLEMGQPEQARPLFDRAGRISAAR